MTAEMLGVLDIVRGCGDMGAVRDAIFWAVAKGNADTGVAMGP